MYIYDSPLNAQTILKEIRVRWQEAKGQILPTAKDAGSVLKKKRSNVFSKAYKIA